MTRAISDIKIVDGVSLKKCLNPSHEGERYVLLEQMTKRKGRPIPYGSNCLKCFNLYNRRDRDTEEKRKKHNARAVRYVKELRVKNGMSWSLWRSVKNRANKQGIPFTITPDDVIVPDKCPVLGIDLIKDPTFLERNGLKGQLRVDNYPSVDRKDPSLGYIKENVTVISWRANNIKGNASLQELQSVVDWLRKS